MSNKSTKPQRAPTKDEMVLALSRLEELRPYLKLPHRDDDDPFEVIRAMFEETLHNRQSIAGVTSYMQTWLAENVRR